MKQILLIVIAISVSVVTIAQQNPIANFHEIKNGLYRGARPETAGLKSLSQMGFKTIINIDDDDVAISQEATDAKALGLKMISIPLSAFYAPSDKDVNDILTLMNDDSMHPTFLHCQHGQDRTGLVTGLFRVEKQKWRAEDAYAEMLKFGFHRVLFALDVYFQKRTGLKVDEN